MSDQTARMLVISPDPDDDEIIGAGGTMARFIQAGGEVTVLTVTARGHLEDEAKRAHQIIGVTDSIFLNLEEPPGYMRAASNLDFSEPIRAAMKRIYPDIVLIPYYDRHQDRRQVYDATMKCITVGSVSNVQMIAAYEAPLETHWNAPYLEAQMTPNWVVDITGQIDVKLDAMKQYTIRTDDHPQPRSLASVKAMAVFRGNHAGFEFGEAFHIIRMTAPPEMFAH